MKTRLASLSLVLMAACTIGLAARGASQSAFDRLCIPPRGVAQRSNIPDIFAFRALRSGRIVDLGATTDLHHGLLAAVEGPSAQEGNPFRGRQRFEEKRCTACHSVWGHGGHLGPEMTVAVAGKTFYELVGDFWNHTPQMIDQVTRVGEPWPTLDPTEMADILSYLYYLRMFDEPGDAARGAEAYGRSRCGSCHSLGKVGGAVGSPLDRYSAYPSSTPLAQAMWNAGPIMQQAQMRTGTPIPQFTGHDMADIQAYIRAEGRRQGREVTLEPLPSPTRGAVVYKSKGCGTCHDGARASAPDLARSTLSKTAAEITGLLWNHSYAMSARMGAQGIRFPQFTNTEMADLIAHLYFLGYAGREGDSKIGSAVFDSKGCATCHKNGIGGAPNLASLVKRTDRAGLASAMWNHAPQMHRTMAERASFWPKFEPGEMRNLAAYLQTLAKPAAPAAATAKPAAPAKAALPAKAAPPAPPKR